MKHLFIIVSLALMIATSCKKEDEKPATTQPIPFTLVGEWEVNGLYKVWIKSNMTYETQLLYKTDNVNGYVYQYNDTILMTTNKSGFELHQFTFTLIKPATDNKSFNCTLLYAWNTDPLPQPATFVRIR
jgi:hypothetical protein